MFKRTHRSVNLPISLNISSSVASYRAVSSDIAGYRDDSAHDPGSESTIISPVSNNIGRLCSSFSLSPSSAANEVLASSSEQNIQLNSGAKSTENILLSNIDSVPLKNLPVQTIKKVRNNILYIYLNRCNIYTYIL